MAISTLYPTITPSLKLDFAKSRQLDPRISFTRPSSGTYMDRNGIVRVAAAGVPRFDHVFSSRTNILSYSEDFTQAIWTKPNGTTVTANQIAAPDASITADLINDPGESGVDQGVTDARYNGLSVVASVFLKKGTASLIRVRQVDGGGDPGHHVVFNLDTLVFSDLSNVTSYGYIDAGNGWYRVWMRYTTTRNGVSLTVRASTGSAANFYAWGAQIEVSNSVTDYIFSGPSSVTDSNIVSAGLLVEETRTNLLLRSEEFDNNAAWATDNSGLTITANSVVSPDGTQNADTLVEAATNTQHNRYQSVGLVSTTIPYTFSAFLKPNTVTRVRLGFGYAGIGGGGWAFFNLANGTVISTTASGADPGTNLSASITPYPNGWYRCVFTVTPSRNDLTYFAGISLLNSSNSDTYTGNTANNLYAWGAQVEQGSFATSYISTTTATVTRTGDVAFIDLPSNNWYDPLEGSLVFQHGDLPLGTGMAPTYPGIGFSTATGTSGSAIQIFFTRSNPDVVYLVRNNGVDQVGQNINQRTAAKLGFSYITNSFSVVRNGTQVGSTDTSGTVPTVGSFNLGHNEKFAGGVLNGTIANVTYYPRTLTVSQLQSLTR